MILLAVSLSTSCEWSKESARKPPPPAQQNEFAPSTKTEAGEVPCPGSPFCSVRFFPETEAEKKSGLSLIKVIGDRTDYSKDDRLGQFVVTFLGKNIAGAQIQLELFSNGSSTPLASRQVTPVETAKLELFLDMFSLEPGNYELRATLSAASSDVTAASYSFTKSDTSAAVRSFPTDGIPINVVPQDHVADGTWPITTGVPMPRGALKETDLNQLKVLEDGKPVPVQFFPRANWFVGGDLKWIGIDFLARYEGGRPHNYRLVKTPTATLPEKPSVKASQTDDLIEVDTGVVRFRVHRKQFAGIEQAWFDANQDGNYSSDEEVIQGAGGPYLVDEKGDLYNSLGDPDKQVEIEEQGLVRVTLRATGWYVKQGGDKLCRFVTRISAFAGQPLLRISHRTLITYDTNQKQLADVGWKVVSKIADPAAQWAFGGDGSARSGSLPSFGSSAFLHQDRSDNFRFGGSGSVTEKAGRRSDGWFSVAGEGKGITLFLKDVYQKFPKELEVAREVAAPNPFHLILHFWPKDGHITFSEPEETAVENIYKIRYAHQGRLLDLKLPTKYGDALRNYYKTETGEEDPENQVSRAIGANGQGLAIGNEFALFFHSANVGTAELGQRAALFQEDPHALADPEWNVATGVEGRLSARDPAAFPVAERALEIGFPGYLKGIVEGGDEYGMWIHANSHDNWIPAGNRARLHRVWQASHYRNVWTPWLLYFRSGQMPQLQWARANTDHFMDVDTNNFDDGRPFHDIAGAMYHCKGFLPWGSESDLSGHWVNPSAFLFRYYLTGDRQAWDLYRLWGDGLARKGVFTLPVSPSVPCHAWRNTYLRETTNTLGELVSYYEATRDPQALLYIHSLSDALLETPLECTAEPTTMPIWHHQWYLRYYDLTGDKRVVTRILNWIGAGFNDLTANAFAYQQTGNIDYLKNPLPAFYDSSHVYYDNPTDRYHGYGGWVNNVGSWWLQGAPYFMAALKEAQLALTPGERPVVYPSSPRYLLGPGAAPTLYEGRYGEHWSDSSVVVLTLPSEKDPQPVHLRLEPMQGYGTTHLAQYFVIAPPSPPFSKSDPIPTPELLASGEYRDSYGKTVIDNPPLQSEKNSGDNVNRVYRVECRSHRCWYFAPWTSSPEAAVLRETYFENGRSNPMKFIGAGRQMFYLRPFDPKAAFKLKFEGDTTQYNLPAAVRVEDSKGALLLEQTIFGFGDRKSAEVTLDPTTSSPPWKFYTSSSSGPWISIEGVPEIFISIDPADLQAIITALGGR